MEYRSGTDGYTKTVERLRRELTRAGESALMVDTVQIEVEDEWATVKQTGVRITNLDGPNRETPLKESLRLRKEGSRWRIMAGLD